MSLTDVQKTTLANHIRANADADVVAALSVRNDTELARLYNLDSSIYVWRSSLTPDEYRAAIVWAEVDTLTEGKARIWSWITNNFQADLKPSDQNFRQGVADAFGAGTTTRTQLLTVAKRAASVYESVFSTGTGTVQSPGDLVVEGEITIQIVGDVLNNF